MSVAFGIDSASEGVSSFTQGASDAVLFFLSFFLALPCFLASLLPCWLAGLLALLACLLACLLPSFLPSFLSPSFWCSHAILRPTEGAVASSPRASYVTTTTARQADEGAHLPPQLGGPPLVLRPPPPPRRPSVGRSAHAAGGACESVFVARITSRNGTAMRNFSRHGNAGLAATCVYNFSGAFGVGTTCTEASDTHTHVLFSHACPVVGCGRRDMR